MDVRLSDFIYRSSRAHSYIVSLNEFKNKQISLIRNRGCAWRTINCRMVVRCLDLLIQTMVYISLLLLHYSSDMYATSQHNLLSPIAIVAESQYPELLRVVDNDNEGYYSDMEETENKIDGGSSIIVERSMMKKLAGRGSEQNDFEQALLMTANSNGAPRGVLNMLSSNNQTAAVIKYMNRSNSPRKVKADFEDLLEESRGRESTRTRSADAGTRESRSRSRHSESSDNSNGDEMKKQFRRTGTSETKDIVPSSGPESDWNSAASFYIDSDSDKEFAVRRGRSKSYGANILPTSVSPVIGALPSSLTPRRVVSANARVNSPSTEPILRQRPAILGSFGFGIAEQDYQLIEQKENTITEDIIKAITAAEDDDYLVSDSGQQMEEQPTISLPIPLSPPQPVRDSANGLLLKPSNLLHPISSAVYSSALSQSPPIGRKDITVVGKVIPSTPAAVDSAPISRPKTGNNERSEIQQNQQYNSLNYPSVSFQSPLKATRPSSASPSMGVYSLRAHRRKEGQTNSQKKIEAPHHDDI